MQAGRTALVGVTLFAAAACADTPSEPTDASRQSCAVDLSASPTVFAEFGGQAALFVSTSPGPCAWTLAHPSWVTVTPTTSGDGPAQLTLSVGTLFDASRSGEVTARTAKLPIQQSPELRLVAPRCLSGRPGQYVFACTVGVEWARNPPSQRIGGPTADLTGFGLPPRWALVSCVACGGFYDLDLHVPVDQPPGQVEVRFRVDDGQGRFATAKAMFTVLPK